MNFVKYAGVAAVALIGVGHAQAQTVTLSATKASSIASDGYHYGDNMLRSYEQTGFYVNGYMQFDLRGIADTATINSVTLTAYLDASYGSPSGAPKSAIYLVNDDSWNNVAGSGTLPALNGIVSPVLSFSQSPLPSGTPVTWTIATSAVSSNLADNMLSLAMHGEKGSISYAYFFGTANAATRPTLTINYSTATGAVPEPATWAMMVLGFGAVGGALRRRPSVATRVRFA